MDDPLLVRRFERFGYLLGDGQCVVDRHRATRDPMRQVIALDELHHQRSYVASGSSRAFFEERNVGDVWMVQRRECLRFAGEPGEPIGIVGKRVGEDFERDIAIQLRIARAVDLPHPASPIRAVTS
jgi:hypothetical protein